MNVQSTNQREICPNPANPVSLVNLHAKVNPTATTNMQVSGTSNVTSSFSDLEMDFKNLSPLKTSQSSENSILNQDFDDIKKNEQASYSSARNSDSIQQKRLSGSSSHSKLSDLAHKMSDFLFSTRRSIDTSCQNLAAFDQSSLHNNDSSNPSPVHSRDNSFASLTSLARNGSRPVSSKRRSFLLRQNFNPQINSANTTINDTDHNTTFNKINPDSSFTINPNSSTASLNSNATKNSVCHFSSKNNTNINTTSSKVKETHYVHVEYDPVTRKRVLNTYEILKDIGAGQHGRVKLAKDLATGTKVAIKIVDRTGKPALMLSRLSRGKSQTQEDKIRKEIAIMKKCDHPHVVKLIEVLDAENSRKIYLVLEYLEKGEIKWQLTPEEVLSTVKAKSEDQGLSGEITLNDCISEPLLTLDQTKKIFRDVLGGLEYLHYQGIIHRDIKPSNLLVSHDGNVKISDFGVSFATTLDGKAQDDVELAKTAGTPAFLAPELCGTEGKNMKVTYKIDIWALGVTLYCFIFGCLPFYADSEYQLFQSICHDDVKFPDMTRWRVATPLTDTEFKLAKDLILKLLDKNPETRIEIDEIKQHPFLLEGSEGKKWQDDKKAWLKGAKIKVSNDEVDDTVVGIGSRIKKRLSDAFKRRSALFDIEKTAKEYKDKQTLDSALALAVSPILLKDDCSYILSEENGPFEDCTNCNSQVSLNIPNDHSPSNYKLSNPATCVCVANIQGKSQDSEKVNKTDSCKSSVYGGVQDAAINMQPDTLSLCGESPSSKDNKLDSGIEGEEEYDYRAELNRDDESREIESVKLTVNPSFASLDSFYDDSYSKFMNPTTNIGSTAYSGFGNYTGRNYNVPNGANSRMPPLYNHRASPNSLTASADESPHSVESRESISLVRKHSQSPSGAPIMLSGSIQASRNTLRGRPPRTKISPALPATDMPLSSARNSRDIAKGTFPANPMLNTTSPVLRNISANNSRNAVFSSIMNSDSSSEDEQKPIEFNRKRYSSKRTADKACNKNSRLTSGGIGKTTIRKAYFTSGDDEDKDEEDSSSNNSNLESSAPPNKVTGNIQENIIDNKPSLPTKSSIYGTKLRLLNKGSDNTDDSDDSDNDEAELFLSFGKPKITSRSYHLPENSMSSHGTQSTSASGSQNDKSSSNGNGKDAISSYVSAENILSLSNPTIVDVPANIFESEQSSLNISSNSPVNNVNQSFVFSKTGAIEDEMAVLNINQDDGFCDQ